MIPANAKVIDVGRKPIDDYIFDAVVSFNQGIDVLIIRGRGAFISKAVDVYNRLSERLADSIELQDVKIGTERRRSYIAITIRRKL